MTRIRIAAGTFKRVFNLTAGAIAMLVATILCAFVAMRLAIHGREVSVPNLAGRSDADAAALARDLGLNLSVENRFYSSAIPPNHVLSQSPIAGSRVRRGWQVRVTESLGAQQVSVPDVLGQAERPASLVVKRLQLELGTVAHLPAPAPSGVVLAQSPPPNSVGLNGPRVALLVADDEPAGASVSYVMPPLIGMTLYAASNRLATAGLHIASATEPDNAPPVPATPAADAGAAASNTAADVAFDVAPAPISANAQIVSQSPLPGRRVSRADVIRVILAKPPSIP